MVCRAIYGRLKHCRDRKSVFALGISLSLVFSVCVGASPATPAAPDAHIRQVRIDTSNGQLILELDTRTAPVATAALIAALEQGGYDDAQVNWIQPHVEIRIAAPAGSKDYPSELDAVPLGLDQQVIADAGKAMTTIQRELEPAWMEAGAGATAQLNQWIVKWRKSFVADFLIGINRTQINEALGYHYERGVASRPVRRGSVALVPAAPGRSTLALAIILGDQPARDGRWVVVGKVSSGLNVAEQIAFEARIHPKQHQPLTPVLVRHARVLAPHQSHGRSS